MGLSDKLKYADLFMKISDAGFLLHPTSLQVLEANPASENWIGDRLSESSNRTMLEFIPQTEHDNFLKAVRISLRRYHPRTFESYFNGADGKSHLMEVTACPLLVDGEDQPVLQVIFRDITEKREAEHKLADAMEQLKRLSNTDAMTGLFNFRHFQERLKQEHLRSARYKTPYSLIFCDLDNFKNYNDTHGHPAGDELLRQLAVVLLKSIRDTDSVYRYGGEEFVIICPQSDAKGATIAAERIRKIVETTAFPYADQQPKGYISFSMGVAAFPEHGVEPENIVEAADSEVYNAKHGGRNQVCTAPTPIRKSEAA